MTKRQKQQLFNAAEDLAKGFCGTCPDLAIDHHAGYSMRRKFERFYDKQNWECEHPGDQCANVLLILWFAEVCGE